MTMRIQEAVAQLRGMLAPQLDEYSLELLDIEIEEQDWEVAYGMALQAAESADVAVPPGLLQAA